jgi:hypothetical protein
MLIFSAVAFAIPDEEVQRLKASYEEFSWAEDHILAVWNSLTPEFKSEIRNEQIEWIKTGRDQEAQALISQGLSYEQAYTDVTNARTEYLVFKQNMAVNPNFEEEYFGSDEEAEMSNNDVELEGNQDLVNAQQGNIPQQFPSPDNNPLIGTWDAKLVLHDQLYPEHIMQQVKTTMVFTNDEAITVINTGNQEKVDRKKAFYKFNENNNLFVCSDENRQKCETVIFKDYNTVIQYISPFDYLELSRLK